MIDIETINPTDVVSQTRTKINSNFENLKSNLEDAQTDILARATQDSVQKGSYIYAADSGTKNALAANLSPAPTAYTIGMAIRIKVANTNDDVCTINLNSLGAKAIKKNHDQALASGDIEAGQVIDLVYDGTVFQMQSQVASTQALDFSTLNPQQGFLINGKIVTSVASNNLTVAIKTLAGADPSASDVVYVRIGNSVRSITSALSVTLNAGTNYFNAGASEFATKEIDYFVYLGYRASNSSVFLGFSRIPYAITYADINTTSTNELYLPYSGTAPASSDEMEVVGRFNAILSAGASYNWSLPGTSIVISRPIYETRWLNFAPTYTGFSAAPSTDVGKYKISGTTIDFKLVTTAGTSNSTSKSFTLPLTAGVLSASVFIPGFTTDNSAWQEHPGVFIITNASNVCNVVKTNANNNFTNSGTVQFNVGGSYPIK